MPKMHLFTNDFPIYGAGLGNDDLLYKLEGPIREAFRNTLVRVADVCGLGDSFESWNLESQDFWILGQTGGVYFRVYGCWSNEEQGLFVFGSPQRLEEWRCDTGRQLAKAVLRVQLQGDTWD